VTVVVEDRRTILGSIVDDMMQLSSLGDIVLDTWSGIPKRYKGTELDDCVVMRNHFQGIIIINDQSGGAIHESPLQENTQEEYMKQRIRMTLSKIVGWFKMNSAKQINFEQRTSGRTVWQRGFYDHIIRNEADLHRIRTYMANNPLQWAIDEENPDHQS
jgi:REP element-mobilizing transposase RayT